MLFEGDDIGRWLERQKNPGTWSQLSPEQQERLSKLGVQPAQAPAPAPAATPAAKGQGKAQQAFQRGLASLTQWVEREGQRAVPRGHSETIAIDGEAEPVTVKLCVWISDTKSRRDKLTSGQRAALAALGMNWVGPLRGAEAAPEPAAPQPAPVQPAPARRKHHEECDKALYEGGTCTCDLIEQYGPPTERDDY